MKWSFPSKIIGLVVDAAKKLFGGKIMENDSIPAEVQKSESDKPSIIQPAPPLTIILKEYNIDEVSELPPLDLDAYVQTVMPLAKKIEEQFGIYHLVPIAQSAHESRMGNSGLSRKGLNLFGITATHSWTSVGAPIISMPTTEYIGGKKIDDMRRDFRAYSTWYASFLDWAHIISSLSIYKTAFNLLRQGEAKAVDGMREVGKIYATDPVYTRKLLDVYGSIKK